MLAAENGSSGRKISHKKKVNRESIEIKHTKPRGVQSRVRYLIELGCISKDGWLYESSTCEQESKKILCFTCSLFQHQCSDYFRASMCSY